LGTSGGEEFQARRKLQAAEIGLAGELESERLRRGKMVRERPCIKAMKIEYFAAGRPRALGAYEQSDGGFEQASGGIALLGLGRSWP
jgi:hypothetical protein